MVSLGGMAFCLCLDILIQHTFKSEENIHFQIFVIFFDKLGQRWRVFTLNRYILNKIKI